MVASAGGALALAPIGTWEQSFVGWTLYNVGNIATQIVAVRLKSMSPPGSLSRTLGTVLGAFWLGNVMSAAFAGVIAATFGLRATIVAGALLMVTATALSFRLRSFATERSRSAAPPGIQPRSVLVASPLVAMLAILPLALFPIYLREVAHVPLERFGIYVGTAALGAALITRVAGRVADAIGEAFALVAMALLASAGAMLVVLAGPDEPAILVGALLLGATGAASLLPRAPVESTCARDAFASLGYQLGITFGHAGGGLLAGVLYGADPLLPFLVTAAVALPAAAAVGVATEATRRARGPADRTA
jgi:predicted MFS family arabinose efflux permease